MPNIFKIDYLARPRLRPARSKDPIVALETAPIGRSGLARRILEKQNTECLMWGYRRKLDSSATSFAFQGFLADLSGSYTSDFVR